MMCYLVNQFVKKENPRIKYYSSFSYPLDSVCMASVKRNGFHKKIKVPCRVTVDPYLISSITKESYGLPPTQYLRSLAGCTAYLWKEKQCTSVSCLLNRTKINLMVFQEKKKKKKGNLNFSRWIIPVAAGRMAMNGKGLFFSCVTVGPPTVPISHSFALLIFDLCAQYLCCFRWEGEPKSKEKNESGHFRRLKK